MVSHKMAFLMPMFSSLQAVKRLSLIQSQAFRPPNVPVNPTLVTLGIQLARYHYSSKNGCKVLIHGFQGWTTRDSPLRLRLRSRGWGWVSRYDLGRKLVIKSGNGKDEYATTIKEQWGKMALFRLLTSFSSLLMKVCQSCPQGLVELYKKGWIYRGELSSTGTQLFSAQPLFWYRGYFTRMEGASTTWTTCWRWFTCPWSEATTRPETMFKDTAVAVNPNDDRYKDLIGQNVNLCQSWTIVRRTRRSWIWYRCG